MRYIVRLREKANLAPVEFNNAEVIGRLKQAAERGQNMLLNRLNASAYRDIEVVQTFWIDDMIVVETNNPTMIDRLTRMPEVESVEPEPTFTTDHFTPSEDDVDEVETLTSIFTWGLEAIRAPQAWNLGFRGGGVPVCTLDTGVYASHPDLAGKLGQFAEFNSNGSIIGTNPRDSHYHGTHVAGTIHGGAEGTRAIGVAPQSTMHHGLVLNGGTGSFAAVMAGVEWGVSIGSRIINMSLGDPGNHTNRPAISNARAANVLMCISSGNGGPNTSGNPGNLYPAFGIGATEHAGNAATFSSGRRLQSSFFGFPPGWPDHFYKPNVSAPGHTVLSALPPAHGTYGHLSGTSMAAPHVAGAAAILLSTGHQRVNTVDKLEQILKETSRWDDRHLRHPTVDTRLGHGEIDVFAAVQEVLR